jgi:ABC-2 type transport system ATP-binding protein
MVGQQKPSAGVARLFGKDVWRERRGLMDRVGIVPEEPDVPPEMTIAQVERFCASLYSRWGAATVSERLRRFKIAPTARFGNLSKGQKKQVMLALALAMSPELLVLDDPTLGLDVVARKVLFEEVISEMAERGISVLITTHDLPGVESIADRVGILRGGTLVLDEEMEALKGRFRRIRFAASPLTLTAGTLLTVRQWGSGTEAVVTDFDELSLERIRAEANVAEVVPMSLEEIFIAVTGEEGAP